MAIITGPNYPIDCTGPQVHGSIGTPFVTIMAKNESAFTVDFAENLEEHVNRVLHEAGIDHTNYKIDWVCTSFAARPQGITIMFYHASMNPATCIKITDFMINNLVCDLIVVTSPSFSASHSCCHHLVPTADGPRAVTVEFLEGCACMV